MRATISNFWNVTRSQVYRELRTLSELRLQLRALLLEVPIEALEVFRFTPSRAATWAERYGFDFRGLVSASEAQDHLVHVNSHPDEATPSNSWGNLLYLFANPVTVVAGEHWSLHYEYERGSRFQLVPQRELQMSPARPGEV